MGDSLCLLEKDGHLGVPGSEDEPRRIVCPAMNHFLPPHRNCIPWGRDAGLSGWRNDCNYIPFYYCCFRDTLYAVKQNLLDGEFMLESIVPICMDHVRRGL